MILQLKEFKEKLSALILPCREKKIVLFGYSYSGQYLRWFADYYHGIEVDYVIWPNMPPNGIPFENEKIYTETLLSFGIKDVQDAVVWMTMPYEGYYKEVLDKYGYVKGINLIDVLGEIYGDDLYWGEQEAGLEPAYMRKTGKRDVQELEFLEWKYGCNFVTAVSKEQMKHALNSAAPYCTSTEKEIFPIIDRCHKRIGVNDAVFDLGCGKGGAMVSLLEYGFKKVGGVEYDEDLYQVAKKNFESLGIGSDRVELVNGDAGELTNELDSYNWFYTYDPFSDETYRKCAKNIIDSARRNPRKVTLICIYPKYHEGIEAAGFKLLSRFEMNMRQRMVNVYEYGE